MSHKYFLGFLMLLVCSFVEVSSRPSNNESGDMKPSEETIDKQPKAILNKEDGSIFYQADTDFHFEEDSTKDIVEKIKEINNGLNKPSRKQVNLNKPLIEKSTGLDRDILEKLQQIIASAKLNTNSQKIYSDNVNSLDDYEIRNPYSRAMKLTANNYMLIPNQIPMISYPYVMNIPVMPTSIDNNLLSHYTNLKSIIPGEAQTRQGQQQPLFPGFPSFPFLSSLPSFPSFPSFSFDNLQFGQTPFASLFPVLIKNPIVAFSQGGGLDNFIEYGQSADVCNRKQKSSDVEIPSIMTTENNLAEKNDLEASTDENGWIKSFDNKSISRKSRSLKKRTITTDAPIQEVDNNKVAKKLYAAKPTITRKPSKKPVNTEPIDDFKQSDSEGDLRFPSGDFTWFWNKKPTSPSPGFFINKLRVRKGGVAIAGPGGVATAGNGGTAIVGPGGLAYTKPGGLAIAGPHARVVALSPYTDFSSVLPHLHQRDEYFLQKSLSSSIREGKLVATGPVIYYHPIKESDPTS